MRSRSMARFAVLVGIGAMLLGVAPLASAQRSVTGAPVTDGSDTPAEGKEKPVETAEKETSSKKTDSMTEVYTETSARTGLGALTRDFLGDQKRIWTSPAHLEFTDAQWIVPIAGFSAGLFVTDAQYSKHLSRDPNTISRYKNISDVGVG